MRRWGVDPSNAEFLSREHQVHADVVDDSGRVSEQSSRAMQSTPIGTPPTLYDVRCVYDSRPVQGFDFNMQANVDVGEESLVFVAQFIAPDGYRAVPREWTVTFDFPPLVVFSDVTLVLQNNGTDVPYNSAYIGAGTTLPVRSFYLVEENAQFGARLEFAGTPPGGNAVIQVYGNLLPVTGVALPFEATNRKI